MEGSIDSYTTKGGDKRFRARIDLPTGEGYDRDRISKVFGTRRDADEWLTKVKHRYYKNEVIQESDQRVDKHFEEWMTKRKQEGIRRNTRSKDETYLSNHVLPEIGHFPLNQVTTQHIQDIIDQADLAGSSKHTLFRITKKFLEGAVVEGKLRENPADPDLIRLPSTNNQSNGQALNWEQARRFLDAASKIGTYGPLYRTALFTGLRRSELLGLKWDVVDLNENLLQVRRTLLRTADGDIYLEEKTKTESSYRVVQLPSELSATLKRHKSAQKDWRAEVGEEEWEGQNFVFTNTTNGDYIVPSNLRRQFNRILEEAGLSSDYTFHDLRRSYITLMAANGSDRTDVSKSAGHSSISTTEDHYRKTLPSVHQEALDDFEDRVLTGG